MLTTQSRDVNNVTLHKVNYSMGSYKILTYILLNILLSIEPPESKKNDTERKNDSRVWQQLVLDFEMQDIYKNCSQVYGRNLCPPFL